MKKIVILLGVVLFISFAITGCGNKLIVKQIEAESFTISYGKSIYQSKDKIDQEKVNSLVKKYNNIELVGTASQAINYDKAITIIFISNDQISGQITIDDEGICRIEDKLDNYIVTAKSNIYEYALKVYQDLEKRNMTNIEDISKPYKDLTSLPKKYTLDMALENHF